MATTSMTDTAMTEAPATLTLSAATTSKAEREPVTGSKPTPYTYDLSHLSATDPNPVQSVSSEPDLQNIARDGAQSLINTLLSHCPIHTTPDGPTISTSLTPGLTSASIIEQKILLPRWKPLPKPKPPTKWESFARKKGIGKFASNASGGAALAERKKNLVYDEEKGEWVKKWGYKGKNKNADSEWLVELDDKKVRKEEAMQGTEKVIRGEGKRERMERMRRQDRKERSNSKRAKGKAG